MPKGKVLVVDDAKIFQDIYKSKLMSEGFHVMTAGNGVEAMAVLTKEKPDIILLDLNMPVMDGFKVLQAVKADPALSSIHVVVFSSRGQPSEIEKAVSLGADSYLIKATSKPNEVVQRVKEIAASLGGK